jgi:hypothetical protein
MRRRTSGVLAGRSRTNDLSSAELPPREVSRRKSVHFVSDYVRDGSSFRITRRETSKSLRFAGFAGC